MSENIVSKFKRMTEELNSIEGVEVISTHELMKQRNALRAENERLRELLETYRNLLHWLDTVDFDYIKEAYDESKAAIYSFDMESDK